MNLPGLGFRQLKDNRKDTYAVSEYAEKLKQSCAKIPRFDRAPTGPTEPGTCPTLTNIGRRLVNAQKHICA